MMIDAYVSMSMIVSDTQPYSERERERERGKERERERERGREISASLVQRIIRAHAALALLAYKLCYRDLCLQPAYPRGTIGGCLLKFETTGTAERLDACHPVMADK